jgi:hypothetical protein
MDALRGLRGALPLNVQFADAPHSSEGIETLSVLPRDARTVTGASGARKAIVSDILDALCSRAEATGARTFCFLNADIQLSQDAVDWIAAGEHDAWLFSREDFDGASGASLGMITAGVDVIALSTIWWRRNRRRFRPYILGEATWDNVYTAIVMCHASAVLENRRPLARHEAHPAAWTPGGGPYARYTQYLAALDAGYFSLWCVYWEGLQQIRQSGGDESSERALAREVFVWRPGPTASAIQGLRKAKAWLRYRFRS